MKYNYFVPHYYDVIFELEKVTDKYMLGIILKSSSLQYTIGTFRAFPKMDCYPVDDPNVLLKTIL